MNKSKCCVCDQLKEHHIDSTEALKYDDATNQGMHYKWVCADCCEAIREHQFIYVG